MIVNIGGNLNYDNQSIHILKVLYRHVLEQRRMYIL